MNLMISRRAERGFTLIELLTVIAIIGILAAIIIPVVGKVRIMARQAECISNLRQTGSAISTFTNDNRGELPGRSGTSPSIARGLESAVRWRIAYNARGQLGYHLAPYFGVAIPTGGSVEIPTLIDRTTLNNMRSATEYQMWVLNARLTRTNYPTMSVATYYPFGWTATGAESAPKRYEEVLKQVPPSRTWVLLQADRKLYDDFGANGGPFVPTTAAPEPVYGGHRNALFFDWSVARIPISEDPRAVITNRS